MHKCKSASDRSLNTLNSKSWSKVSIQSPYVPWYFSLNCSYGMWCEFNVLEYFFDTIYCTRWGRDTCTVDVRNSVKIYCCSYHWGKLLQNWWLHHECSLLSSRFLCSLGSAAGGRQTNPRVFVIKFWWLADQLFLFVIKFCLCWQILYVRYYLLLMLADQPLCVYSCDGYIENVRRTAQSPIDTS